MKKYTKSLLFITFIISSTVFADPIDSIKTGTKEYFDSARFYKKLLFKSKKHKLSKLIYDAFIISEKIQPVSISAIVDPYLDLKEFKGKIIRKIVINSLDPFQTDVNIPDFKPTNKIVRFENAIHLQTIRLFVKNQLLFKTNEALVPEKIKESERLLRQTENIRDSKITVVAVGKDSVDIKVVTQDNWSKGIDSNEDPTNWKLTAYERNVFGFGHIVEYAQKRDLLNNNYLGNEGYYLIPNIKNSYVSAKGYKSEYANSKSKGVVIERSFFSPLTKWAGGVSYVQQENIFARSRFDTAAIKPWVTHQQKELYLGRSFIIDKHDISAYKRRLILFGRVYARQYQQRPSFEYDYNEINQNFVITLGSIGISKRNFYKERFVYSLGRNEDIPIGRAISANFGYINSELFNNFYIGTRYALGRKFENFGYFSLSAEVGGFHTGQSIRENITKIKAFYFTNLLHLGRWQMRQFINYSFVQGINLNNNQYTNLNNNSDFYNFNTSQIIGTSQMLLTFQTLVITPFSFIGFRFAPIFFGGVGVTGVGITNYFRNPVYQTYGLGLLVKNDRLVNNTLQISFGLYVNEPANPFTFKGNPSGVNQNRLRDYDIGKPSLIDLN